MSSALHPLNRHLFDLLMAARDTHILKASRAAQILNQVARASYMCCPRVSGESSECVLKKSPIDVTDSHCMFID